MFNPRTLNTLLVATLSPYHTDSRTPRCRGFEILAGCSWIHTSFKDSRTLRVRGPRMQAFVHTQALWAPDGRGPRKNSKDWRTPKFQGLQTVVDSMPLGFVGVEALWASVPFGPDPRSLPKHRGLRTAVGLKCGSRSRGPPSFLAARP